MVLRHTCQLQNGPVTPHGACCILSHSVLSDSSKTHGTIPACLSVILQGTHWSGLPFCSSGGLPNPRIKPGPSTLQTDSLTI